MSEHCERSITFTIPDPLDGPGIQVKVVEKDGKLIFTVQTEETSTKALDLRGLFFHIDESVLPGLTVTNADPIITDTKIAKNSVLDLGHGANMKGAVKNGFDVGIKFGTPGVGKDDVDGPVSFTLERTGTSDLTLDDIAHMEFGARTTSTGTKVTVIAPAAPDAVNDAYNIFEDGQSGLDDPSTVPAGVLFEVLANDTDGDGDTLTITDIFGALHGTVQIVDGADADLLPGDAVLYTPFEDYAGADGFTYCISDNNGGTDFAEVSVAIEAVADVPDVDVQVLAGNAVNEIRLIVTATQTDADSSEFIDRILTSAVPGGVTLAPVSVNPGDEPNEIVQEYLLTLPLDTDNDFDLTFTAVSKETSNGDEETGSETIDIVYEFNSSTTGAQFSAVDQNIWSTGDEFVFVDDRFVGVNTGNFNETVGGALFANVNGHIKFGLQSILTFEGGEIDATADYDVTVETNYNKTTDQLLLDTSAILTAAAFSTEGPSGSYVLDLVWDILLNASAGVDIDLGVLGSINESVGIPTIDLGPGSFRILNVDSDTLSGTIDFPPPLNAFSVDYDWPDITTNGDTPPNPVVASGSSDNFLQLNIDIDTLVTQLLGIPNVFDPPELTAGPFFADIDLLDVDVSGGLNFLQEFTMAMGGLTGVLTFENGENQVFAIGDSLLISNASQIDALGDDDGLVEFTFNVVPTATLDNETDLGFNIGGEVKLLSVELGYDIEVASDSITLGPLADFGETAPIAEINVFGGDPFALNFSSDQVSFFA